MKGQLDGVHWHGDGDWEWVLLAAPFIALFFIGLLMLLPYVFG